MQMYETKYKSLYYKKQNSEQKKKNIFFPSQIKQIEENQSYNCNYIKDKQFQQLYKQNIQLKKRQVSLNKHIEQLKKALQQSQKGFLHPQVKASQELKQLIKTKNQNKKLIEKKSAIIQTQHMVMKKGGSGINKKSGQQKQKIRDLLTLIQKLKRSLVESQANLKQYQFENNLLKKEKQKQQKQFKQIQLRTISGKEDALEFQKKYKIARRDYENQKGKVYRLENKIRNLQFQIAQKRKLQQQNTLLKQQNKNLQRIKRINISGDLKFNSSNIDNELNQIDQRNLIQTQQQQIDQIKKMYIQKKTQAQLYESKCNSLMNQIQVYEQEIPHLRKKTKIIPIFNEYCKDQQTVYKIIDYIDKHKQGDETKNNQKITQYRVEQLIYQKGRLAAQLQRVQALYSNLRETIQYKQKMFQIQNKELIKKVQELKPQQTNKVVQFKGIKYDDDVSVFNLETQTTNQIGFNFFDLYLGQVILNQIKGNKTAIIATVDFYNHDTQRSKEVKNQRFNLNSQFNFRVTQDNFLIQYFDNNNVVIQFWTIQGQKANLIGQSKISLKSLIMRSKQGYAPVVINSVGIYHKMRLIGSLNYRMRMRLPIFQRIKLFKQKGIISQDQLINKRKLVIHIIKAQGMRRFMKLFVYFKLQMQDYYTHTVDSDNPYWDYWKVLDIGFTQDFKRDLKHPIQFNLLDDNAPLNNDGLNDLIGIARQIQMNRINFIGLIKNQSIQVNKQIMSQKGLNQGYLHVRVFWHDSLNQSNLQYIFNEKLSKNWQMDIKNKIIKGLNSKGYSAIQAFKKFDNDGDKVINSQQFQVFQINQNMCSNVLNIKIPREDLLIFYGKMKHPFNFKNFQNYFGKGKIKQSSIKQINQMLQDNSQQLGQPKNQLQQKKTLHQYIKDKLQHGSSLVEIGLAIDQSEDGIIDKSELIKFLDKQKVIIREKDIDDFFDKYQTNGKVRIIKFITHFKDVQNSQIII